MDETTAQASPVKPKKVPDHRRTLTDRSKKQKEHNQENASKQFETLKQERGLVVEFDPETRRLTIIISAASKPKQSDSGKSLIVASTRGFVRTDCEVDGKTLSLNLNAIVPND